MPTACFVVVFHKFLVDLRTVPIDGLAATYESYYHVPFGLKKVGTAETLRRYSGICIVGVECPSGANKAHIFRRVHGHLAHHAP